MNLIKSTFLLLALFSVGIFVSCQKESLEVEQIAQEEPIVQNGIFRSDGEEPVSLAIPEELQANPDFPVTVTENFMEVVNPFTGELLSGYFTVGSTEEFDETKYAFLQLSGPIVNILPQQDPNGPISVNDLYDYCMGNCPLVIPLYQCDEHCANWAMEECLRDPNCYCVTI
jgi:hypothetical protein